MQARDPRHPPQPTPALFEPFLFLSPIKKERCRPVVCWRYMHGTRTGGLVLCQMCNEIPPCRILYRYEHGTYLLLSRIWSPNDGELGDLRAQHPVLG